MKTIELTYYDGKKVYINPEQIIYFSWGSGADSDKTYIVFFSGVYMWVKETPEQVLKKIQECE